MLPTRFLDVPYPTRPEVSNDAVIPGGMFLASVAIGMAPAVATVGILLDASRSGIAGSACLLVAGLSIAALSSNA